MHKGLIISKIQDTLPKIKKLLEVNKDLELTASDWGAFAKRLDFVQLDLVFLDVDSLTDQEKENCLKLLGKHKIHYVVISSNSSSAYLALKNNAIDYIIKPMCQDQVNEAVAKAVNWNPMDDMLIERSQPPKRLVINSSEGSYFFDYDEIIRCQAESNYTKIFCINNTKIIAKTLKYISAKLPEHTFIRTHQSHLVNSNHVKKVKHGESSHIVTTDGCTIPISRNKRGYIRQVLLG